MKYQPKGKVKKKKSSKKCLDYKGWFFGVGECVKQKECRNARTVRCWDSDCSLLGYWEEPRCYGHKGGK